jgi:hypothetical protein
MKMIRTISISIGLLAVGLLTAFAQSPEPMGMIHGHVTNPTGGSPASGYVSLSTDSGRTSRYTFQVNSSGDFQGEAAPGTYTIVFRQPDTPPDKIIDSIKNIDIVAGQDTAQDIDMSRKEFIDKLRPEQREQLEKIKQHNSEAMKANDVIRVLNADLRICTQDIKDVDSATDPQTKAAKYREIETLMSRDTQAKPDASVLWAELGQAQLGLMKYREAESSFTKALELESASKRPNPQIQSLANSALAQIHERTGMGAGTDARTPVLNQPAQASALPAPTQHQYEDLAPPPSPPAPAPTISMGQTKAQVTAAFGEPQRKAAAGPKEIYFYTDLKMKVTFTNGKVSSIE